MANAHIGRVETIDGGVTVTPLSGSESPLTQGMPVYMNDLIKTDADASVRLRLHDGSSLLIDAGQTISLDTNFVDVSASGILISEDSVTAITVTGITTVSSVDGTVQVVRDGVPRELVAGDLLYPGDTLIAAADGSATLLLSDGSETDIEPGSQSRLGGSNAAQQEGEFLTSGIDDPAEIQAAILAGRDPSQDAPAPGVGETESNEGHTHIRILPSGRAVTPDSGHETHGQDLPISFDIEELLQDQDSIPDLGVTYIAGGPGVVDEAGLSSGSRSNDGSAATSGSFTIDTGNDQLAAFEVQDKDGNWIDVTAGNVMVQGVNGVLTVTLNNGVYNWSYDLTTNLTTHTDTDTLDGDSDRGAADQVPGDMFPVRVIDNDGDISPPASIDIVVNDDGPSVTSTALPVDALQVDESLLAQDAQLDVSGQFAIVAGADQPAAVSYALSVPGGTGADSGLVDVATGQRILLSEVNGVIQGRTETGGDLVFTLSVDGAGVVTLDQLRALRHPDGTDPDDVLNLASPDLVQLTATVTDADGDTASAVLDLGSAVSFRDDGPQAVDDIAGTAEDMSITYNVLGNDIAGADGPATVTAASLASGQGTVTFLPNGDITVTPTAGYEGPIVVNYTIVDSDGDPSSATLTVNVAPDSVPVLSVQDGTVDEAALPAGSNAASPNEAASGGFGINTGGDSVGSLVIDGVDVTNGGTVAGAYGTLTVTLTNGVYSWDYLLDANAPHPDTTSTGTAEGIAEQFNVVLTDSDGDVVNDVLDIAILDDGPQAVDDIAATGEDAAITYNVLGNDVAGADGPATVTAASLASGQGTVTFLPNGDITVTPTAGYEGPIVVNYTIIDSDGDPSSATLTVNVAPDSVPVLSVQDGTVDEAALPAGSVAASPNEAASGGFGINTGGDSVGSLVIDGVDVTNGGTVAGAYGTLTVTLTNGVYSWDYLLDANAPHPDTTSTGTAEGIAEQFNVVLTDSDGDVANDVLDIAILDDGPQAVDDIAGTAEDMSITYNVLGNDIAGADGPATVTAASLASGQGTVTFLPNGDITVTPTAGYEGPIVVNYTIIDSDGDPSSATLTVNVAPDSVPVLSVQDGTVDEAALPAGSVAASPNEAASGGFGINTGGDSVGSLVIDGVDVTNGGTVAGAYGTLTVTLTNGVYSWDYLLDANAPHPDTTSTGTAEGIAEQFNVVLTDSDGDVANDVLDIAILDDGPAITSTALPGGGLQVDETDLATDAQLDVSGQFTVVTGADTPASVDYALSVPGGAGADSGVVDTASGERVLLTNVNGVIEGRTETGGELVFTLGVNGSGLVTLDQIRAVAHPDGNNPDDVLNLGATDTAVLTGTVTDADGDSSSATLGLGSAISFRDDGPSLTGGLLGEFNEGSGTTVLGAVDTVLNINPGADGLGSIDITNSNTLGGTLEVINGQLVYTPPADVDNGPDGNTLRLDNFQITVTDGDGDSATTQVSFEVVGPNLAIGSGADDEGPDDGIDPHVLNTTPVASGTIIGDTGVDFIAGDPGGTASIDTNANMILVLDISGSMRTSINFTDSNGVTSSMSRLDAQKLAVIALLTEMANSGAAEVRVHIVGFSSDASTLGTFDLVGGDLQSAIDAVNATTAGGVTNYEAGLQAAIDWSAVSGNLLSGGNVINQTFFVSDGKPNRYLNDDGSLSGSASASTAMGQILGSDGTNEVQILENQFGPIEAVGIALTSQSDIDNLDQVEGESRNSDAADNIFTANDLVDALSDLNPLNQLAPLGNDVINSGDGNDIVFGDSLFTDILADNQGLATPDGTGWRVFAELEATPGWGREETTDYIRSNHVELSAESTLDAAGRAGGNDIIDAGAGNDIVYGQEGDDIITGGAGNDILSGGSGADIFIWTANESGSDEIIDFNTTEGDVVNIADLLTGPDNLTAAELDSSYMSIASGSDTVITVFGSGGNTDQVIQLAGFDTTGQSSVQIIENLLGNGSLLTD